MRVVVLYRSKSEHGRTVETMLRDYNMRNARDIEAIDIDSRDGTEMAKLYGVTQYPAIIAMASDGQMQKMWQGLPLPLINEIDFYAIQ